MPDSEHPMFHSSLCISFLPFYSKGTCNLRSLTILAYMLGLYDYVNGNLEAGFLLYPKICLGKRPELQLLLINFSGLW